MRPAGFRHTEETKRKMAQAAKRGPRSEETKRKISETRKARGYRLSEAAKANLSAKLKGRKVSEETRKRMSEARKGEKNYNFGKPLPIGVKQKLSRVLTGRAVSDETKEKIRKAATGRILSEETRKKLSIMKKGKRLSLSDEQRKKWSEARRLEKNPAWNGGVSFEPYSRDWTEKLKKSIRERDGYTCRLCNHYPSPEVHHIDYDKQNCNPRNLTTLCHTCHLKTNKDRESWQVFFEERM